MAVDITLNNITSGYNTAKINTNFQRVEDALQDSLSRSGTGPNQMNADIDMNSNDLLNVGILDAHDVTVDGQPVTGVLDQAIEAAAEAAASAEEAAISAGLAAEHAEQIVDAKSFGAKGDGSTDDYAALQAAINAANTSRRRLYIPKGTYIISAGLKLPSHSYVYGDGFDTIIKIADSATYDVTALTNEHNTGSYLTNTGDEDITIERLTVDGNGRRASTGRSGTCVQFSTVAHGVIRDVKAINGRLHCIDICAGNTNTGPDEGYEVPGSTVTSYTPGPSFDILIENCITNDSVNDDGLTTHYSHHITIINHTALMSNGIAPGSTSHGIEIDDGSYEVSIIGGYAKGWVCGLQIKGHITNPAARNVYVSGFVSEGNTFNYDIQHGSQPTRSETAYGVTLESCVSIRPVLTLGQAAVYALSCRDYGGLNVRNFQCIGDPATSNTLAGVFQLQDGLHDSSFENIYFKDVNRPINGAFRVVSSTGENVRLKNIVAEDCYGWIAYVSNTTTGIVIENVHATLTNITTPIAGVLLIAAGVTTHVNTYISNITANGGYLAAVVDAAVPSYIAMPLGRHRISVSETQWVHSDSDGGVTPGGIHRMQKIGYLGGDQNLAAGEGTAYGFGYKVQAGVEYEVGYVAAVKISGTDANTGFSLNFGTRDNADAGTQATTRLQIIATVLQALTDNTFSLGTAALRFAAGYFQKLYFGSGVPFLTSNAGTPETVVTAPVGSICADTTNGGLSIKKTGTGNTGWVSLTPLIGTATYDPISLIDGAGVSTTVTVTGAVLGDLAVTSFSLSTQGITVTAAVTAADTVTVRFQNETGGTIDLASGTLKAAVWKF